MIPSTSFDPSRQLDIYFRVNRSGSKTLTFLNTSAQPIDVSSFYFEYIIRDSPGGNILLRLTQYTGGITISGTGVNLINISITSALTNLTPGEYYGELYKSSTDKTYLSGRAIFHDGAFDGVSSDTTSIIVDDSGKVSITIGDSGSGTMTSAQILTALGAQTATHFLGGPTPSFRTITDADIPSAIARLISPNFTGIPTAPTAAAATNDTRLANAAFVQQEITSAVVGLFDDRGNYNASINTFPASGGSGTAGAILKGDIWTISVAGTLGGTSVVALQTVRALVDTPGQTAGNWAISGASITASNGLTKVGSDIQLGGTTVGANNISIDPNGEFTIGSDDGLATAGRIVWSPISNHSVTIYSSLTGGTSQSNIDFTAGEILVSRGSFAAFPGITYAEDLRSFFGSFSLVDKGYVLGSKTYDGSQTFKAGQIAVGSAPFYMQSGLALNTPADGAMEYHNSHLYFTIGSTRYQLDQQGTGIVGAANGGTGIANNPASTITISGGFATTLTVTATTSVTLPTTGTLSTLAGAETLTNKTLGTGTVFSVIPTINDGITFTFNPSATVAGLNAGSHAGIPSVLNNGDIGYNSTSNYMWNRVNGNTLIMHGSTNGMASNQIAYGLNSTELQRSGNLTFVTNRILGTTLYLTVSAGTATAGTGPIKMTSSGTGLTGLLGTAEAGVFEYTTYGAWFSPAGSVRHKILHGLIGGSAPATNSIGAILDYFGTSATRVLSTPNTWISIVGDDGNTYKLPGYS